MRKILIIFILQIVIFGCKKDDEDFNFDMNETYLPLHVGNEWHYKSFRESDSTIYISKITDYVKKGENYYYEMSTEKHYKYGNDYNSNKIYLRTSDGIQYYCFVNGVEYVYRIFKDTFLIDKTFNNLKIKSYKSTSKFELDSFSFKLSENITYLFEIGNVSDDTGIFETYYKGIGLLKFGWFRGEDLLIYAKINGVEYGKY